MLENEFEKLYLTFRANYYRQMVQMIGVRPGLLSATEHYCVEIIYLLDNPTLTQFAQFLSISLPNANYKVNSLLEKGYVKKVPSPHDKREYYLEVTDKFLRYYGLNDKSNAQLMQRIRENFTQEELDNLNATLEKINALMRPTQEKMGHD